MGYKIVYRKNKLYELGKYFNFILDLNIVKNKKKLYRFINYDLIYSIFF